MKKKITLTSFLSVFGLTLFPHAGCKHSSGMDRESKAKMKEFGNLMKKKGISHIYFVHGTWAGDSPLGVIETMEKIHVGDMRKIFNFDTNILKDKIKKVVDEVYKDLGNFTPNYLKLFAELVGNNIACESIIWGSANYHEARVLGAIELIKKVAKNINNLSENERILLIGHSHAGQLFALLTKFLEDEEMSLLNKNENKSMLEKLVKVVGLFGYENVLQIREDMKKINKVYLDFVTLGTPPRYQWGKGEGEKYQLLNIINDYHLNKLISVKGVLETKDGDYIQQWGIGGTDAFHDNNEYIENIIGQEQYYISKGDFSPGKERHLPKHGDVPYGKTLLIPYKKEKKYCWDTLLGHGLYTLEENMLLNTEIIVNEFYKN
ncbi:MAG: hypothetical protein E3K37_12325 [Candidatus Kuenenia sp.]|nr:hypothetical protein [Candidatus Kuenenia hertensis]